MTSPGRHGDAAGVVATTFSGLCVRCVTTTQPLSLSLLYWCRLVANACSRGLTSPHFSVGPSLAQPWQRGRLQRPAAVLRQPLLSCFSVVAHRAGARVREAALPHRLYAARTLA
jgi:hypothetical protein